MISYDINIENFIFHVVHHGDNEPILMDNTPIDGFEEFFKKRINEILNGNKFLFINDSLFLNAIKDIEKNNSTFVSISKNLAKQFHQHQDKRVKAGVMILIKALINQAPKYILIKYDHASVITYKTADRKAVLEEIKNTFSKSKDALQKSAIIDLSEKIPNAIIIDKSERGDITDFFKGFLGVKRFHTTETLTEKVKHCFLETIKAHKLELPGDFTSQASLTFYNHVQSFKSFNEEETVKSLFGNYYSQQIAGTFRRKIQQEDIVGEEFDFNKKIRKPQKKKFKTIEGVTIQYDTIAENTIKITTRNEETKIVITTKKLIEEPC